MKSKNQNKQKTFEKEYEKIMNEFKKRNIPFSQNPQWVNPGDFIIKFSLYHEMPNSITSTDTLINF